MTYTLILLRHGESEWNALNLFTGWVDVNLTAKGEAEATRGGQMLLEQGILPDVAHTSLQKRAIRTTNLALENCERHWIPVRRSWRLNERHYGDLTGLDKAETRQRHGDEQLQAWRRGYATPPPPIADDNPFNPNDDERYAKCFAGGWYLSGDLARRDADGWFWFVGRADDVIKSAGHLIGPFEVESVLMEHAAVAEAGVIGIPDPLLGERIKAFVALKPGVSREPADLDVLRREISAHARRRLGPAVAPREIAFDDNLPKTRSGKIMRRLLRARELGLAEGDLSTLEVPAAPEGESR